MSFWSSLARWMRRTQMLWKSALLGFAMWGCLVWLEIVYKSHTNPATVSAEEVSSIMLRWALLTILFLSLLQYAFVIVRAVKMLQSSRQGSEPTNLAARLVWALVVFTLIAVVSVGVWAKAEVFVLQTFPPWSGVAHSWDNLVVGMIALLFLCLDKLSSPFLGAAARDVVKLDWAILISLTIGTVFLARFGGRTAHEFIVGCNTGMLVFHMMLATLLFGIEEQHA